MLPFSLVEQSSFKELISTCQPGVSLPSRYTIVKTLKQKLEASKVAVKTALADVEFVATTADCWTAQRKSYLGVTVNWLTQNSFERKSAALACRRIMGSHTFDLLAESIQKVHSEYGTKSKVVGTTTDSGSNFVKAFSIFAPSEDELEISVVDISNTLSSSINRDLELPPHQRCAAHLLNLVSTSDAAAAEQHYQYKKISRSTFGKCQALWNKTARSALATEVVQNESSLQLKRPCATRWNSVFDAVQRLNKIIQTEGPQSLNNICQRLDLPR